jgi:hypothetical protein
MSVASSIVLDDVEFFPSPDGGYVITWTKDGNRRRDTVSEVLGLMLMAILERLEKKPDSLPVVPKKVVAKRVIRKRGKI